MTCRGVHYRIHKRAALPLGIGHVLHASRGRIDETDNIGNRQRARRRIKRRKSVAQHRARGVLPKWLATVMAGRSARPLRGFENPHQAFRHRTDAIHTLASQLVGEEVEALVFIEEDDGLLSPVFSRVAPALYFIRLNGSYNPSE